MARPRIIYENEKPLEGEVTTKMTKVLHMVRVISRGIQGAIPDPETGFYTARDVEKEIETKLAQGWVLMGQPQFTGMEAHGVVADAGFRLMYFFTKEE